jgi:hypothetical protein
MPFLSVVLRLFGGNFFFNDVRYANRYFFCITTEGQPDSIVHDIENMVRSYIEKVVFIQVLKLLLGNKMFNDQIALLEKLSCKNLVVLTFYEHHFF